MDLSRMTSSLRQIRGFDNWPELLLQRVFFRGTSVQVHRVAGLHVVVDHRASDAGSIRECIAGPMYARFLSQMTLPTPAVVLDLGANVGGFSLLLHLRGVAFGRLVCVEMNPKTCERLRFNVLGNDLSNASVINAAVCATARTLTVRLGRGSTGDSIYKGTDHADGAVDRTVQGMSLDAVCEKTIGEGVIIDVCKMDIEGAEDEVLLDPDSENTSLARVRYLVTELHNGATIERLFGMLRARGFERVAGDAADGACGVHLFRNTKLTEVAGTRLITAVHTAFEEEAGAGSARSGSGSGGSGGGGVGAALLFVPFLVGLLLVARSLLPRPRAGRREVITAGGRYRG